MENEENIKIGLRIRDLRKQHKIQGTDLARTLGISRATLYRYESGEVGKLPIQTIKDIAQALHTTPGYIMGWEDESGKPIEETNQAAETVAAHIDEDTPKHEREQIINFIENLKKARK